MTQRGPQSTEPTVEQEIDLGRYYVFLMSDQSIDLMRNAQTPSITETVLSLDSTEAYRLMRSLQEMFQQANG